MPAAAKHLVIVYHDSCIDGLASAWALHKKWGGYKGTTITYVPYAHAKTGDSEENILSALRADSELYFVDVAPRKTFLDSLLAPDPAGQKKTDTITVLDHHLTNARELAQYAPPAATGFTAPLLNIRIDENHPSASHMVWQILFPKKPAPAFLEMVNKMDMGKDMASQKDYAAAAFIDSRSIRSIREAFNSCSTLARLTYEQMAWAGENILNDQKNRIAKLDNHVMHAKLQILPDTPALSVPVINADVSHFGRCISDYLNGLGQKSGAGLALAWHMNGDGSVSVSLRSTGIPDASAVAAHFCKTMGATGGGHKTSAAVHFSSLQQFSACIPLQSGKTAPAKKPAGPAP